MKFGLTEIGLIAVFLVVGYYMWPISPSAYSGNRCMQQEADRVLIRTGGFGWIARYQYTAIVKFCKTQEQE